MKNAEDDILTYFFSEKIRLRILCELSAKQTLADNSHEMPYLIFSEKKKSICYDFAEALRVKH